MAGDYASLGFELDPAGITRGIRELDKLDKAEEKVGRTGKTAAGQIQKGFGSAADQMKSTNRLTLTAANSLGKIQTLVGGITFAAFGRSALNASTQFESSLNNVQSKLQVTDDLMASLRDQAKDLGSTTAFSASQAADAMGYLAQAGLDADQIYKAMPTTLNLAAAAGIDLGRAADIATNVMGAFGEEVGALPGIADTLAAATAKSNTNMSELAMAIKQAGPVAAGFGIDVRGAAAAIGILANNGIKGEQAGMTLKNAMLNLATPVGATEDAFEDLNLTTDKFYTRMADGSLKFKGFGNAIDVVKDSGADAAQVIQLFGREAGPGMTALLQTGRHALDGLEKDLDATGFAAEAASIKTKGLPGAIKSMASAWEGFNLAVMGSGGNSIAAVGIGLVTKALRSMTGAVDTLGPGLSGIVEMFRTSTAWPIDTIKNAGLAFGGIATAVAGLAGSGAVIRGLGLAMATLSSPLVIAGALATAALTIYQNWDQLKQWWQTTQFREKTASIATRGIEAARELTQSFSDWWARPLPDKIVSIGTAGVAVARNVAQNFFNWWDNRNLADKAPGVITTAVEQSRAKLDTFFSWWDRTSLDDKKATVVAAVDIARRSAEAFASWWATPLPDKIASIKTAAIDLAVSAVDGFYSLWNTTIKPHAPEIVTTSIDSAVTTVRGFLNDWRDASLPEMVARVETSALELAETAVGSLQRAWDNSTLKEKTPKIITTAIDDAFTIVGNIIDLWQDWKPVSWALDLTYDAIEKAWDIAQGFTEWWNKPLQEKTASLIYGTLDLAFDAGKKVFAWWNNIFKPDGKELEITFADVGAVSQKAWDAAKEIGAGIVDGFNSFMSDHPMIGDFFSDLVTDIKREAGQLADAMKQAGADMMAGLLDGAKKKYEDVKDWIANIDLNPFNNSKEKAASNAADYVEAHKKPLIEGMDDVGAEVADTVANSIDREEGRIKSAMRKLGGWLPFGLSKGVEDEKRELSSTMQDLAQQTADDYADAAGIQSPALIMVPLGGFIVAGLAKGINESGGLIKGAVSGMAESTRELFADLGTGWIDSLTGSLRSGDGLRDTLTGLRDEAKDWLLDIGSDFAKNKVKLLFATDDEREGIEASQKKITDFVSDVKGIFGKLPDGIGNSITSLAGSVTGAFGGIKDKIVSMFSGNGLSGISNGIGVVFEKVKGLLGGFGGTLGDIFNSGVGSLDNAMGQASSMFSGTMATVLGKAGPWAAALSTAYEVGFFGGAKKLQDTGFHIGITLGDIVGQQYEQFVKKKAFFLGNKTINRFSEMEQSVIDEFSGMVDDTLSGVKTNMAALGVDIGETVREGLTIDRQVISNNNLAETTAAFIAEVNTEAYRLAFDQLTPEVRRVVADLAVEIGDGVDGIASALEIVGITAAEVVQPLENMGINLGSTVTASNEAGQALVELFGGMESFTAGTNKLLNEFYTEAERGSITLKSAAIEVANFNDMLGLTGPAAIDTDREMRQLLDGLDLSQAAHREVFLAATEVADSMATVADSGKSLDEALNTAAPSIASFDASVVQSGADAANAATGVDTLATSATQLQTGATAGTVALDGLATAVPERMTAVNTSITGALDSLVAQSNDAAANLAASAVVVNESYSGVAIDLTNAASHHQQVLNMSAEEMSSYADQVANTIAAGGEAMTIGAIRIADETHGIKENIVNMVVGMGARTSDEFANWVNSIDTRTAQGRDLMLQAQEYVSAAASDHASRVELASAGLIDSAGTVEISLQGMASTINTKTTEGAALYESMMSRVVNATGSATQIEGIMQNAMNDAVWSAGAINAVPAIVGSAMSAAGDAAASGLNATVRASNAAYAAASTADFERHRAAAQATQAQSSANTSRYQSVQSQNYATNSQRSANTANYNSVRSQNSSNRSSSYANTSDYYSNRSRNAANTSEWYKTRAQKAYNEIESRNGGGDGSFATGLGRVPRDGFRATLHKDEMILPKSAADFFRREGVPIVNNASSSNVTHINSDAGNAHALELIRMQLVKAQEASSNDSQKQIDQLQAQYQALRALIVATQSQTRTLDELETTNDRLARQQQLAV